MNKFMESRAFLKILSLLFAISLYVFTDLETIDAFLPTESKQTETISNVPVTVNYDDERFIIKGMPETVEVTFKGTSSQLNVTRIKREYEVVANLANVSVGTYDIRLQVKNVETGVEATVNPRQVTVEVLERGSKELPVSLQIQGKSVLQNAGYIIGNSSLNKTNVVVTGAKENVEKVASLQAYINVTNQRQNFTEKVTVVAYDNNGNEIEGISIAPDTLEATVNIVKIGQEAVSKNVPIEVEQIGTTKNNVFIDSIEISPEEVTIFGREEDLANITSVTASVDVSSITEDTEKEVNLTIPSDVTFTTPMAVNATITLEKEATRTFTNVSIAHRNLSSDVTLSFLGASTGTVNVTAFPSILDTITKNNIQLFINLDGLEAGTHHVPLQAVSIAHARIDTDDRKIKIELTERDTSSEETPETDQETEEEPTEEEQLENQPAEPNDESNQGSRE